jgi:hypothetical protein
MTQTVLGWCLVVSGSLAAVLGVLLLRQQHITALLREDAARREEELAHLVEKRLPTVLRRQRGVRGHDPGLRRRELADSGFAGRLDAVLAAFREVTADAERRAGEAAETAVRGVADRLLTLVYQQQDLIETTEHRHHDPGVLEDLYPIDHAAQHLARRLFSLRLLTGCGPGRQRPTTGLHDLLRGAIGTAPGYHRVKILDRPRVAVRTQAVESLIHLFGHLVENAVLVSPATSDVEISTMRVGNGIAVSVSDGGKGISDHELERISALAKGTVPASVSDLGDPPRLGYPVVGLVARRHDLTVTVDRESRLAGVRVTVTLPTALLSDGDGDGGGLAGLSVPAQAPPLVPGPPPLVPDTPPPMPTTAPAGPASAATGERAAAAERRLPERRPAGAEPTEPGPARPERLRPEPGQPEPGQPESAQPRPAAQEFAETETAGAEAAEPAAGASPAPRTARSPQRTRHGLPVRNRQTPAADDLPAQPAARSAPSVDPTEAGARMAAWQKAARPTSPNSGDDASR